VAGGVVVDLAEEVGSPVVAVGVAAVADFQAAAPAADGNSMNNLSNAELKKIETAVEQVETVTNGEIVPAIFLSSDSYLGARWRFSTLFSLLITYIIFTSITFSSDMPATTVRQVSIWILLLLLLGFALMKIPFLLRLVIESEVLATEVKQRAFQCFFENGLHRTRHQTGILIFVSMLERRVEIIADEGIHKKVGEEYWYAVIQQMIPLIRQNRISEAMLLAVERCREPLSCHFPKTTDDSNEITNQVISE
jgi:putative membrane protein